MNKTALIDILRKLLNTDAELDFLLRLSAKDLETLVACVRGRVDQG